MKTTTIKLLNPLTGHEGLIQEVKLQAPSLLQYARIGEIGGWMGPEGQRVYVENDAAIAAYLEECVVEPRDKLLLGQIELADAMNLKEALVDFFVAARRASSPPKPPTTSSST